MVGFEGLGSNEGKVLGRPPHRAVDTLGKGWKRGCRGMRHGGKLARHGGNCAFLDFQTCRNRLGALAVHSPAKRPFPAYTVQ
jgi:hypothetical protein